METENKKEIPLFNRTIKDDDVFGNLKTQFTIELTEYDTSKMKGYKEGSKVFKGYTCKLATLKPNRKNPINRIDINPSNRFIRDAILSMYLAYEELIKKR
jgi:hypothetical protein